MKTDQRKFASAAARAARDCTLFFFCGPDEAGASAAAQRLVAQLPDAGERVEFSGAEIRSDPVRLVDEARSSSLFGGTRHLYIRAQGDEAHDAVKTFLDMADGGETSGACPVIIVATSATDKSRTAKLLAERPDALVAMFWPPDLASVTAQVRTMADAAGLRLAGDLAERIARGAGLDVRLAQSEVTKLALYLDASPQAPHLADSAALDAIGASSEEDGFMPIVDAVLSGNTDRVAGEIRRMRELDLNAVGVALALERRAAQLARLCAKLEPGAGVAGLLERERVFFNEREAVGRQLQRWNAGKLERLVPRLAELHRSLLANSANGHVILAQSLIFICRFAAGAHSVRARAA